VVLAPSGEQIEIVLGEQRAVLVGVGGGLRSYTIAGSDLIDGYGIAEMSTSGRGQGMRSTASSAGPAGGSPSTNRTGSS
jgi:hypothetical protein